jgi:FkbM family methyltransferase
MSYFKISWVDEYIKHEKDKVFFDVGSYNGTDGMRFKTAYPESRVISIEADKSLFNKIKDNKKLVGIEVIHAAACDMDGPVQFYSAIGPRKGVGSINKPTIHINKVPGAEFGDSVAVDGIRIDTICSKLGISNISVLHMDIQTGEYFALCGLGKMRPDIIFVEDGGHRLYENAKNTSPLLVEMGYTNIPITEITLGDKLWIKI